ncbi:MAG: UDP-N-acetylenolpyruvoylglucosamine reductase [Candidatus Makaraimicrobium thalassicum]|nr:MAG: UDP-N-acetylenolpyruvoylglucosamine reductase [Candidatus Omnitrophota bacterium]
MLNRKVRDDLRGLCEKHGGRIVFDHPLCGHSTISIGGNASAWYMPASMEELREAKKILDDSGIRTVVIGAGSNVLFPDKGLDAVVISLSAGAFREVRIEGNTVTAGAGADMGGFISDCCACGLAGLEGLAGIPATVGGALVTNAAYRTAISECLSRVLVLDAAGRAQWVGKKDIGFGYRFSSFDKRETILQAVFRLNEVPAADLKKKLRGYFAEKMERQPLDKRTLGCVFKNPGQGEYTSGELIDRAGMKGHCRGGAKISEKHANFIVNTGGAASADVAGLMDDARRKVSEAFSVELQPEIEIL